MGLTVTLDGHTNLLTEFSVRSDFKGFTAMVSPKLDFPLTYNRGFDVKPGTSISILFIKKFCRYDLGILHSKKSQAFKLLNSPRKKKKIGLVLY